MTDSAGPASSDPQVLRLSRLYVAVVADVLDRLGFRSQVMSHHMRPLTSNHVLAGRAYTVQAVPTSEIKENPYEHEIGAVDAVSVGAVVTIATGGCHDASIWGELLCTRAIARGAVGAVVDGAIRDIRGLEQMCFPTFATAVSANDSRGRLSVISYGSPVVCAGVGVSVGDLVLGDLDGVAVIPRAAANDVLDEAEAKSSKEDTVRELLNDGLSVADVYARHEVL